jgi:hypothetical protein
MVIKPALMGAIFRMRMIVYPAKPVIKVMGADNGHYGRYQKPKMESMPNLFCKKEKNTNAEYGKG